MKKWKMVLAGAAMAMTLTFGTAFVPSNETAAVAFAADRYVCDDGGDEDHPQIYLVEESVKEHKGTYDGSVQGKFKFVDRNTHKLLYSLRIKFNWEEGARSTYQINNGKTQYIYGAPNELKYMQQACYDVLRSR